MPNILLAEDDPAQAKAIRFNLESAGFQVTVANDGTEAWEYAQQGQFDLVITDYGMPRMTGADLCRNLREHVDYSRTPIVLMTAFARDLDLDRLRDELGLTTIVSKPFSMDRLVRVAKLLAGFHSLGLDCNAPAGQPASKTDD